MLPSILQNLTTYVLKAMDINNSFMSESSHVDGYKQKYSDERAKFRDLQKSHKELSNRCSEYRLRDVILHDEVCSFYEKANKIKQ